jgi:hypothetical protein
MIKALRYIAIIAICTVILFLGYTFYNAKKTQKEIDTTKTTIVLQLQWVSKLETATMTLQKIVKGKQAFRDLLPASMWDNALQNFLFEDSLDMIATAEITAWFDLAALTTWAVAVQPNRSIILTLPKAVILHAALTPETKPFLRKRGILTQGDIQLETDIRNKTLETLRSEAIQKGLLVTAEQKAIDAFGQLFSKIGYTLQDIVIAK